MPSSTLTQKGQTTIPKEIREHLDLKPGDPLFFLIRPNGQVVLKPTRTDVLALKGLLKGKKKVSLEDMDKAIKRRHQFQ